MQRKRAIAEIRRFNRTYLPFMSFMDANYLGTGYSLTEARVLFEVQDKPGCGAAEVARALRVDKGYMSRMVRKLERGGLVERGSSEEDARMRPLELTAQGEAFVEELAEGGEELVAEALEGATDEQVSELAGHMQAIVKLLRDVAETNGSHNAAGGR